MESVDSGMSPPKDPPGFLTPFDIDGLRGLMVDGVGHTEALSGSSWNKKTTQGSDSIDNYF